MAHIFALLLSCIVWIVEFTVALLALWVTHARLEALQAAIAAEVRAAYEQQALRTNRLDTWKGHLALRGGCGDTILVTSFDDPDLPGLPYKARDRINTLIAQHLHQAGRWSAWWMRRAMVDMMWEDQAPRATASAHQRLTALAELRARNERVAQAMRAVASPPHP